MRLALLRQKGGVPLAPSSLNWLASTSPLLSCRVAYGVSEGASRGTGGVKGGTRQLSGAAYVEVDRLERHAGERGRKVHKVEVGRLLRPGKAEWGRDEDAELRHT